MRHVNRGAAPPVMLSLVQLEPDRKWSTDGQPEVHAAIQEGLRHAQHRACGYCESLLPRGGAVEHVHPKSKPACVAGPSPANWHYHWDNLLLVCGSKDHCDGPKADHDLCADVLFPDQMDATTRHFDVNSYTGEITVARDLAEPLRGKAAQAIEALVLNDSSLRQKRRAVIKQLTHECSTTGEQLARHLLACSEGFATTIESFFS